MECNVWWMKWMSVWWHNASTAVIVRLRIGRYNCGWHFGRRLYGRIGTRSHLHRKSFLRHCRTIIAGRLRQLVLVEQSTSRAFFNYFRTGMSTTKARPLLGTQLTFVIHFDGWCTCNVIERVAIRLNLIIIVIDVVYLQVAMLWHIVRDLEWQLSSVVWSRKYFLRQFVLYFVVTSNKSLRFGLGNRNRYE